MTSCPSCHASCRGDDAICHKCGMTLDAMPFESVSELLTAAGSRQSVLESRIFLFLCFLGLSPLILATFESPRLILDALSVWTGLCWGILLFRLFAPPSLGIKTAIGVLLATSFVVMPVFEVSLSLWPKESETWLTSDSLPKRLLAYVGVVGIREEFFKAIPVLMAMWLSPSLRQPRSGVVLGMMAGVGFAATENVYYVYLTLSEALETAGRSDKTALLMPIYNNLVRTMVGPFAHATFSGLLGSFAASAVSRGSFGTFLAGLLLSASLHGAYNTVVGFAGPLGVVVLGGVLFLTMIAHAGASTTGAQPSSGEGLFSRTIVRSPPRSGPMPTSRMVAGVAPPVPTPSPQGSWVLSVPGSGDVVIPPYVALRIGRDSTACDIVINDPSVSRLHATISMKGPQPQVVRVSKIGVITVNLAETEGGLLAEGDEIGIGGAVLRIGRAAPGKSFEALVSRLPTDSSR